MTRIRTLDFLPTIFQTQTNSEFLAATLDQLVNPPVTKRIEGFVGSRFGYGINANDYYVTEPTKVRTDYQLEPGIVFLKNNETVAKDFISYPGLLDALSLQGGVTNNNNRLFESQFYSWDSFTNLDALINYNQYYWLPEGPPAVTVTSDVVYLNNEFVVTVTGNEYNIKPIGANEGTDNPVLTLLRGGRYVFTFQNPDGSVNNSAKFWIQGEPTFNGFSLTQPNLNTRDVLGVENNGRQELPAGAVIFSPPQPNAQNEFNFALTATVDLICDKPVEQVDGLPLSEVNNIDGVTELDGRTIMFYKSPTSAAGDYPPNRFFTISVNDGIVQLVPSILIPEETRIVPIYGTSYIGLPFYKDVTNNLVARIPYLSAALDTLYYQDSTVEVRRGVIQLIENNNLNTINVETDILGQKNYTSKNGVIFTNGLKVSFDGDVVPASYLQGEYYVQGVGTSIQLVPVESLIVPEPYTTQTSIPYDKINYDMSTYDGTLYIPSTPDYITIARNAVNNNPWSRSNRWFHIDVIKATATYNNDPTILTTYASSTNKAQRPIIEFYPNLKLFNSGTVAKASVDFVDDRTTDVFNDVAGQAVWYPDVNTYTAYTGTVSASPIVNMGQFIPGQQYRITDLGTTALATWLQLGASVTNDGQFTIGQQYIITSNPATDGTNWSQIAGTNNLLTKNLIPGNPYKISSLGNLSQSQWNTIAGTTGITYIVGSTFVCAVAGPTTGTGTASQTYVYGDILTAVRPGTILGAGTGTAFNTLFTAQVSGEIGSGEMITGLSYKITFVGSTTWAALGSTFTPAPVIVPGQTYIINTLGTTNWNTVAGTTGVTYQPNDIITAVSAGTGTGTAYVATFTTSGSGVGTGKVTQGNGTSLAVTTTTITIPATDVTGTFTTGMYINDVKIDALSVLPVNTRILSISGTTTLTMVVNWIDPTPVLTGSTNVSFAASNKNNSDLVLFSGARIVFINEQNPNVRNKIYVANLSTISGTAYPVITLTEAPDGLVVEEDQFTVLRGALYQGKSLYYLNDDYVLAQQKNDVNTPPKFDVFDENGISFGNKDVYESSTFEGSTLFEYLVPEIGVNDPVLGFPVSYSSINNVGDIRFNVSLNTQKFDYVAGVNQSVPETVSINTGYVHNFTGYKGAIVSAGNFVIGTTYRIVSVGTTDYTAIGSVSNTVGTEFIATGVGKGTGEAVQISDIFYRDTFKRLIGWQTAVAPSVQYQTFEFKYTANIPPLELQPGETFTYTVNCDVPQLSASETVWPSLQVYNNNNLLTPEIDYTVVNTDVQTQITVTLNKDVDTYIQVLILSNKVSKNAYYGIPINLSNNPFNTDITSVDIGDIRGQYQTIFYNNPNTSGELFGPNNTRDLGNLVPWGNRIIQNSASLILPGVFLRTSNHNLFDALLYNSREYIKFKLLLIDTVNKLSFNQRFDPAFVLDEALDMMTSVKNQEMPFFWSDMIPNKAAYITNTYTFFNATDTTTFPLSKIYDFTKANYNGVLVYLQTKISGTTITKQLFRNIDYTVSTDAPSLVITKDLTNGDKIIIKEYDQTYGSYIPNTPTKLGLYPITVPKVFQDTAYSTPTWFIVGHDGSFNKLYGEYDQELGILNDYRDQALFEFETRVYNNLKLSSEIPINDVDITPGYFRDTQFTYNEWLNMYSPNFLDWIGQNSLDYRTQIFNAGNPYTYNYRGSKDTLNERFILQGYWRGIYTYYYDTSTPNLTPWEMIGYKDQPSWWETRYGPAPYTSENLVLWQDMEDGRDWNNGNPVIIDDYKRPGLTSIIPVDDQGNLINPLDSLVGEFNNKSLQRDWIVGDDAAVEFSYRRSSTYPFDYMRLQALMKPADFFNLGADLDNYKYNAEFNQYLINNRSHLVPGNIQIYGNGIAKTSYINWIVDYQKQLGVDSTTNIQNLIKNLDVRLVYRLAGFSDKTLLRFFVEKGAPVSKNASLLIPDESYQILLYENQSYDKLVYSSVIVQRVSNGYKIFGNSQTQNYFKILRPKLEGATYDITVQDETVEIAQNYSDVVELVPYSAFFYTTQEVSQFLISYGKYLETQGAKFDSQEVGIQINWQQMAAEFLYWSQVGWQNGSVITLNPCARTLKIDKDSQIVQPLTLRQTNFVLNQNLYPIETRDLSVFRNGTEFSVTALNQGDSIAYGQFNLSNLEHGIVFDNITLFDDTIYNLISGLKQNRIFVRGTKSADWNGTMFASGFIYNQDNIQEYSADLKYTKGAIVKYKNKYWTALKIIQPSQRFNELDWKETEYEEIQKGLLPNPSTRSAESIIYYDTNKGNLESDADQLGFSLIGFRNRPYMESADLTDITQVNVYKNMIKEKGTRAIINAFKGAQLPQGGIDYEVYENWAIKAGEFGGVLNSNFIQFKLNQNYLTGNPGIVGLTDGESVQGAQQTVPIYSLYNYGRPINSANVLPTLSEYVPSTLYPTAGYVNYNDVKMSAYFYSNLPAAVDKNGVLVPIDNFYVRDYVWIADYLAKWQVLTPKSIGQVLQGRSNQNGTTTIIFAEPHGLSQYDIFAIVNFDTAVNGYYVALQIIDPYQILINLTLPPNIRTITGQGIGLKFSSQRVDKPSDIQNLPLLDAEFVKNTVWVDENTDGGWAVYRKGINYQFDREFYKTSAVTFGSAVAYTPNGDFLFGDSGAGRVYRVQYDALTKEYDDDQTLTGGVSFGSTIVHSENIFAISEPTGTPKVHLYYVNDTTITDDIQFLQTINASSISGSITNFGSALALSGDANWLYISDYATTAPIRNNVHVYKKPNTITNAGSFTVGQAYQITSVGDTDFTAIGADENKIGIIFKATGAGSGTGVANLITYQYVTTIAGPNVTPDKFSYSLATNYYGDILTVGAPNEDFDINTANWGRAYVYNRLIQNYETQNNSTGGNATINLVWTPVVGQPLYVYRNNVLVSSSNYSVSGSTLTYTGTFTAGDIITVSGNEFVLVQTLTTETDPRIGVQFGYSIDNNTNATEILVGAPFAVSTENNEGAVYRYTNASARFGYILGTNDVDVTSARKLLINGYPVTIPVGNAEDAAFAINNAIITNISAEATNGKLNIYLTNQNLAVANQELTIAVTEEITLTELGFKLYTQTQTLECPHQVGPTQFGTVVKFDENNSVAISAPSGTRFAQTTFDFIDDENLDNDTVFDNNSTQFLETFNNAGAVYVYDYLENYNESLANIGAYTYAQSCNAKNLVYGAQPRYGTALDFHAKKIVVGTPNFMPDTFDGQVIVFNNETGLPNWSVYRQSNEIVDINRVQNIQIFSAETNNTLTNLDYIDPLQGKILGAIRQNIDVVSNVDPATYNNNLNTQSGFVWGAAQVGSIWFDTTNVRFVNYHQNDNVYNAKYWGTLFPGSDVAMYTWIASNVPPETYEGPGVPKDIGLYSVQSTVNASNNVVPVYYFWARDTGIISKQAGKNLADITLASYLANPQGSGINYLAPLLPNAVALYNCQPYINANDSVLSIGYSTGQNDDPSHSEYKLIRENFKDDFLPGVPDAANNIDEPESLYAKMIDSLCGVVDYDPGSEDPGQIVPDPLLPKAVQSGIYSRPRQSFFYNRFGALKNYLQYANSILRLFPITEIRPGATYLKKSGENYDTSDYWEYINWWAPGYDNNTKSSVQVPLYADLLALNVPTGTIVTVTQNSQGLGETYIREENLDNDLVWTRIGLQKGTIKFKSVLWNYDEGNFGFGDGFFSSTPYDQYPNVETRWIIRALNEQIWTNDLLIYRNRALILLFEYIQAETVENQNYLPWLNKTSLVDVAHTIRELVPLTNFVSDNQEFLEGYVNETKPYHVVIKEFLFDYKGTDVFEGQLTDFDVPAQWVTTDNKFVSPQLVYQNPDAEYEYVPSSNVWTQTEYTNWFNNYGVSFTGQPNYQITALASYVTLNSNFMIVDNAQGFPINGVIKITSANNPNNYEYIAYNFVDRALNLLGGLVRGQNGTEAMNHIPGELIYIDLPPVLLLNGGRKYANPPRVVAVTPDGYPAPREEAILEAVMTYQGNEDLYSVSEVRVISPGSGYTALPRIVIDPSETYEFTSTGINNTNHTINLYAPALRTGDLIRYVSTSTEATRLEDGQWYYVNVLDTTSNTTLALYTTYADAVNDTFRVEIETTATTNLIIGQLELGAKASAVTSAYPVRENNITLRYDRTSYTSQIRDWEPGLFYGSQFATTDIASLASSGIGLESTLPPVSQVLASNGGFVMPIIGSSNFQSNQWSGFERTSTSIAANNAIKLTFTTDPLSDANPSGSTIGFTVGMPVKFTGNTGPITANTTYYVNQVIDSEYFTISAAPGGSELALGNANVNMSVYTAQVTNTALLTVEYPGIRTVTATSATNNIVTIANSVAGTSGTAGFYTGLPLLFPDDIFGGLIKNTVYYVTSVIDDNNFTLSTSDNPIRIQITAINLFNQILLENTIGLNINDPVIFDNMYIDNIQVTNFGNIIEGTIYYIKEIGNGFITISTSPGGSEFTLSQVLAGSTSYAFVTSQIDTLTLTNASGTITVNVGMPVSPGQIDGKMFTFYPTSSTFEDVDLMTVNNLLTKTIQKTIAATNTIALDGNNSNVYKGLPFTVASNIGGLVAGTTYTVTDFGKITVTVNGSSSIDNGLSCDTTESLYVNMPITFSGSGIGNVVISYTYYVHSILSPTRFTIKETLSGSAVVLTTATGNMIGVGASYIKAGTSVTADATGPVTLTQKITSLPTFDINYVLGGYNVDIVTAGTGFTLNNTITIKGTLLGGTSPANDLTMKVKGIDAIVPGAYSWSLPLESNGNITGVIVSGNPNSTTQNYYLKVKTANTVEVYADPLLQVPVSGIDFPYVGGSFAYLPEPFYFTPSIVRYNDRVYSCVVSNNDDEFVFGKWEFIDVSSRKLNAMDRAKGWYQPTVNMPGNELDQLFTGITYPNTTYRGNKFDPNYQFDVDTELRDENFYPKNVNLFGPVFNGLNYIIAANMPTSAGIVVDAEVSDDWLIGKLANQPLDFTDLQYFQNRYVMTSSNSAAPILQSTDGKVWSPNGFFLPSGVNRDENIYFRKKLIGAGLSMGAVTRGPDRWVTVGTNIITSGAGVVWREVYKFDTTDAFLYDTKYVTTPGFTGYIAVGTKNNKKCILYSILGETWNEVPQSAFNPSDPSTAFYAVTHDQNQLVAVTNGGTIYRAFTATNWVLAYFNPLDTAALNDVHFANNTFGTVGDNGKLITSTNASSWTPRATGTTEGLNFIIYTGSPKNEWTITGNNNTVLQSTNIALNPIVWDRTQVFTRPDPAYTVQGAQFDFGYGPEELVPGVVTDQLTMIVNTRPGTNWLANEYQNVGYNVVSVELPINADNEYSFANIVNTPCNVGVYLVENGLSVTLYETADYTVDWINKVVMPVIPLSGSQMLRVDVYEVGNGDQLVKSSTEIDPLVHNETTGFKEIFLNANYTDYIFNGGGLVQPTTDSITVQALSTSASTNSITVEDITKFAENDDINFAGQVFGGVTEGTTYYVKTVNSILGTITISDTLVANVAGPVVELDDASGNDMSVVIQKGPGALWAEPAVFYNGTLLTSGRTNTVIRTKSSTNSLVTYSTAGMSTGQSIVFDNNIFGGLAAHSVYIIDQVLSSTEFTLVGVSVTNALGSSTFITNDYAVGLAPNEITAKVIFAQNYNTNTDYISFSFFGETETEQYGFTVPLVETFAGSGNISSYPLQNYINQTTESNAIVEIDGLRIMPSDYTINHSFDTITFVSVVPPTSTIAVTTYNDTKRQAFNTQYFNSTVQVTPIVNVFNSLTPIINQTQVPSSNGTYFTVDSTTGMAVGVSAMFQGSSAFGGVALNGTMYTISYVNTLTNEFQVQDENGVTYPTSAGTGLMQLQLTNPTVGPAVRVQTAIPHGYSQATNYVTPYMVRIDGVLGSIQLNNNHFYIHVIDEYRFDLYLDVYNPNVDSTNVPLTNCNSYVSGGYVWIDNAFDVINDYDQTNVDRLWVTVNGYRVASSKLGIHLGHYLNILTPINIGDEIIITSMMPTATPDEQTYINIVNKDGVGSVYRCNSNTRTWLTDSAGMFDTTIVVQDIDKITNKNVQTNTTPVLELGYYYIPLVGDKNDIVDVKVYNETKSKFVDQNFIFIEVTGMGPLAKIQANDDLTQGDVLTITTLEGKLIYINGEYMRIESVDTVNRICDVARGVNGSSILTYIPKYSEVFSLLEDNKMNVINYNETWNPIPGVYNATKGDPLQIATSNGASFLRTDVS